MSVFLKLEGLRKYFASSGVLAVADVSLEVARGEVLALIGENGTGKTTLMNLLFGVYQPDAGVIQIDGETVSISSPQEAISHGLGMVQQHFALVPSFTVAQNVLLGREPGKMGFCDDSDAERYVAALANDLGFAIDVRKRVRDLTIGMQQRVEILKALAGDARLLILDEPTAVLTPAEATDLLRMVRRLADRGTAVVFISHKLPEIQTVSDRIIVMRRGEIVGEVRNGGATNSELARMMVGRDVLLTALRRATPPGEADAVLEVKDLSCTPGETGDAGLHAVSLSVSRGEIVGIAGVSGNGQDDLISVISALRRTEQGSVTVAGTRVSNTSPRQARNAGIAHIAEDRMTVGLNRQATLEENAISTSYRTRRFSRFGVLRRKSAQKFAQSLINEFEIRGAAPRRVIGSLSGGNLQKIVIGRELDGAPSVVLANQPTRGLDVGSIEFVHQALSAARDRGAGVLLVSAELDEIIALSDRIAVMYDGQLFGPFPADRISRARIGQLMAGSEAEAADGPPETHTSTRTGEES